MELSTGKITLIMTVMTFASVAFMPFIVAATKKWDKRTIYICGMTFSAVFMAMFGLFGTMNMVTIVIFSVAYCISSICYWQLMPAMIYDVCEVDQLVNNKERAGLVISLQTLSESFANAIGLQMLGLILKFAGFNGDAPVQLDTTLVWTNLCMTIIPAVFMALSIVMIICYPVTKDMYNKILEALERRKNGEEINMNEFSKLK
jgi:GPH family glycoside/pentoside/hexuronide:cation symporter